MLYLGFKLLQHNRIDFPVNLDKVLNLKFLGVNSIWFIKRIFQNINDIIYCYIDMFPFHFVFELLVIPLIYSHILV